MAENKLADISMDFENTTSEEEIQEMLITYCDYEYDKGDNMMVFSYDDLIIEHYYDWSNIYIKRK